MIESSTFHLILKHFINWSYLIEGQLVISLQFQTGLQSYFKYAHGNSRCRYQSANKAYQRMEGNKNNGRFKIRIERINHCLSMKNFDKHNFDYKRDEMTSNNCLISGYCLDVNSKKN